MAKKKMGGLGKGLDSLFADLSDDTGSEASNSTLPLREIEPDPEQPRKRFDDDALNQLADSITENGLLQPIAVRPKKVGPGYIIIAGERRWRAARLAGLDEVPVIIKDVTDEQAAALALIENLQREDLNPMEEAEGYRALMDQFGMNQETVAARVGRSRSAVANCLRLLTLDEDVRKLVEEGRLSSGHARAVLSIQDESKRLTAAMSMVQSGMSVRQAEAYVKKLNQPAEKKTEMEVPKEFQPDYYAEVERKLEGSLGRRVQIDHKKKKGKITLEYYGDEDLERLANALAAVTL